MPEKTVGEQETAAMTTNLLLDRPHVERVTGSESKVAEREEQDKYQGKDTLNGQGSPEELDNDDKETEERPEEIERAQEKVEGNKGSPSPHETPAKVQDSAQGGFTMPKETVGEQKTAAMPTKLLLDRPHVEGVTEPEPKITEREERDKDQNEGSLNGEESPEELDRDDKETEEEEPERPQEEPERPQETVESNKGSPPPHETPAKDEDSAQGGPKSTKGLSQSSKDSKAGGAKTKSVARSSPPRETPKRDGKPAQTRAEPTKAPERRSKDSKTGNAKTGGHATSRGWVSPRRDTKTKSPPTDPGPSLASRFGFERGESNDPKKWTGKGFKREAY